MKHTSGPWRIETTLSGYYVTGGGGYVARMVAGSYEVNIPNALLIAAAPDMLAALRGLTVLEKHDDGSITVGPRGWEMVQAAIAKAEGRA